MFFEKYDEVYTFKNSEIGKVSEFLEWLQRQGPAGYYVVKTGDEITKKSTIRGTGVNSFAPVVNVEVLNIYDECIVKLNLQAFKVTEIAFSIILILCFLCIIVFFVLKLYYEIFLPIILLFLYALFFMAHIHFFKKMLKKN